MTISDEIRPTPLSGPSGLSGFGIDDEWPDKVAGHIETVVGEVRRRTFEPLRTISTGIVLGIIIGVMAQLAIVLLIIAGTRILDSYLFPGSVWASYLIVGGIFSLIGVFLWSKRKPRSRDER